MMMMINDGLITEIFNDASSVADVELWKKI